MIGDFYAAKELASGYQPLLLCEFTFADGTVYRASTHPLSDTYGGIPQSGTFEYGNQEWVPRVQNQDIGNTQSMSDLGVDIPPQVTVILSDPSKTVYQEWELGKGFKGATLKLYQVLFDAGDTTTGSFSSNSPAPVKFIGTCAGAITDQESITITATSLLNFTQKQMPPQRIQPICSWDFPPDQPSRSDALNNPFSIFKQCGYSYGESGGFGNPDPSTSLAYQRCSFDVNACVARLGDSGASVPIQFDQFGNRTGRFGGYQFTPPAYSGRQRPYVSGNWEDIINAGTEAKYGDYMPLCYGETWVNPLVMGIWGDGNYTNLEVALCFGEVSRIHMVLVNGIQVSQFYPDADPGYRPTDNSIPSDTTTTQFKNGYWKTINDGRRSGQPNPNPGWGKQGDPYGSVASIYISVLRQVASENSVPTVSILLDGAKVGVYSDVDTVALQFSRSPVWILRDLLLKSGWSDQYLNIQSFIDSADFCSTVVSFDSMSGAYQNFYNESGSPDFERFTVGFTVRSRVAFGELIRGVRNAMRAILYFDFNTGKLTLRVKGTLADQQPDPITGSNYNDPVPSVSADGTVTDGYAAYHFDESSIVKDQQGRSSLAIAQRSNADSPNKIGLQFLNRENSYNGDSVTVVDVEDVNRIGSEISGSIPVIGVQTFDHARRSINCNLAEGYRGNPRLDFIGSAIGDTGGTLIFTFTTSVKASHLGVGDICLISDQQSGLILQTVRLIRIKPSTNYETAQIVAVFHNDNWYQNTFGQSEQPIYARAQDLGRRAPYSWRPGYIQPMPGDAYYGATDRNFAVLPQYSFAADGSVLATVNITGRLPINAFSKYLGKPKLELVGVGATGGGFQGGTSYFACIAELESATSASLMSPSSNSVMLHLSPTQGTLQFIVQAWNPEPAAWAAFAGHDPAEMSFQEWGTGAPSVISMSGTFSENDWTPPDQMFSKFVWEVRKIQHGGVAGGTLAGINPAVGPLSASVNLFTPYDIGSTMDWTGYELSVYGLNPNGTERLGVQLPVPMANFTILSNDNVNLVVAQDPTTAVLPDGQTDYGHGDEIPLLPNDVVVIRIKPTFGEDAGGKYFEDPNWVNALNTLGPGFSISNVYHVFPNPVVLTVDSPDDLDFPVADGDYVVLTGVSGAATADKWLVGSTDTVAKTFVPVGLPSSGLFSINQPKVYRQFQGLLPGNEKGRLAFVISGTGKGTFAVISDNTNTRCYISGDWPVEPDDTTRIIICDPQPLQVYLGNTVSNSSRDPVLCGSLDIHNYAGQSILIHARSSASDGRLSSIVLDKFREIYVLGSGALATLTAPPTYYTIMPSGGVALVDLRNGLEQRMVLPVTSVRKPIYTANAISAGQQLTLHFDQPGGGLEVLPTLEGGPGGFASDTSDRIHVSGTASTRTTVTFVYHGDYWVIKALNSTRMAIT